MTGPPPRRVALVTGCAKKNGIGYAIALALARAGVDLVVTDLVATGVPNLFERLEDRDPAWPGLEAVVSSVRALGVDAVSVLGDVSRQADVERMVAAAVERFGRLDILVNNAGAPQGADTADIAEVPPDAWDAVMSVNARGAFLMCRAVVPHMRRQGWGRIVNISSIAAKRGMKRLAAYSASKAAIIGLTRSVAMDVAASGITVNAICPGHVRTSRARSTIPDERIALEIPVGRYGEGRDVAATVAYLVSDAASFLTAQAIHVDGGELPTG